jgi:hypothetical protein
MLTAYIANFIFFVCRLCLTVWHRSWMEDDIRGKTGRTTQRQQGEEQPALPEKTRSFDVCPCNRCSTNLLWQVFFFFLFVGGITCCLQPQQTGEEGRILLTWVDEVARVRTAGYNLEELLLP